MRLMRFRQKKESNINRLPPIEANPLILNDLFFLSPRPLRIIIIRSATLLQFGFVKSQCCVVTKARNYVTLLHLDCK